MIRLEFVADLEPRRQIGEPLRGGINERGLHALVNAGQDRAPNTMRRPPNPILMIWPPSRLRASALQRLAREKADAEQRQCRAQIEHEHAGRDLGQLLALGRCQNRR
jgi:hypothetical protein